MKPWVLWLLIGIVSVVGGILALMNPFAASITVELFIGYMLIVIGTLIILSAFQDRGWGVRIWALLLGVLVAVVGINLVTNPLQGVLALTLVVAVLLGLLGIIRLVIAFNPLAASACWPLVFSGVLSLALAAMIFANYPYSSAVVLGLFLAVDLISNGVSLIVLGLARRSGETTEA